MPAAPLHPNEIRRLAAVQRLRMMGTPAEERFDKITRLARRMFNMPMAMIDIVGGKRAWLKSSQGFDSIEVPRPLSYCHHAVLNNNICIIPDARLDSRIVDNPFAATFVFYAGVPLTFEGENVGVLCVCDVVPRDMTPEQMELLSDLAELAEQELQVAALSESQMVLARANEELSQKALVDPLTRVWNRGAISELAARELEHAVGAGQATSLLMVDIDNFKRVNDTHGHLGGDEILRKVSEKLRNAIRPFDAVGRYGGEEFLVVLPNCSELHVMSAAERIREEVSRSPVLFDGREVPVTVSIGGTTSRDGSHFVGLLVKAADEALYKAKAAGRNRCCLRSITPSLMMRSVRPLPQ